MAGLDSAFGGFQQLHRVVYESAHKSLIEKEGLGLNEIGP